MDGNGNVYPRAGSQIAFARLATALAVTSMGALAVGAMAIGRLAIKGMVMQHGRIERLTIGELEVERLVVRDQLTPPASARV
jgi:hypothetical protein